MTCYTAPLIISTGVLFWATGFVMVCCRIWMRLQLQGHKLEVDDWLILAASIIACAMVVNGILGCTFGTMGRDDESVSEQTTYNQDKINYIQEVVEKPAYGAIKASVLFFYRRIFQTVDTFRHANNIAIITVAGWTLAFLGASIFVCGTRLAAAWDPNASKDRFGASQWVILLCFAITDVVLNALIIWMPYPQLRKLQSIERKKWWAIAFVFMLGGIDTLTSFVRLTFIISEQTIPAFDERVHFRQGSAPLFWTLLEVTIGIIAANLPALAPLFRGRRSRGPRRLAS